MTNAGPAAGGTVIGMRFPFVAPIVGVTSYPEPVAELRTGDRLVVAHDPANPVDANAMAVRTPAGATCGYLPAKLAAQLRDTFGDHVRFAASVAEVLTGGGGRGIRVSVTEPFDDEPADTDAGETDVDAGETDDAAQTTPVAQVRVVGSGRVLGPLERTDPATRTVLVRVGAGTVTYPADLVEIDEPTPTPA